MAAHLLGRSVLVALVAAGAEEVFKGISYGPMPCKQHDCTIHEDDFMAEAAKPMWGPRGRHDLQVMKQLGASHVRIYGNNPANDHTAFLDEAHRLGLGVIVGISDYPYTQMPGNCMTTEYDCFGQVKESYLGNLRTGFLRSDGTYHPALRQVIAVNEPDLKAPGIFAPRSVMKTIISGLDGMFGAEEAANATGGLPNFTATFSFGICSGCGHFQTLPALGQMWQLRDAMLNPLAYGYAPRNNLTQLYHDRFVNSFNTANPAGDMQNLFLNHYEAAFSHTPVFIQEYHKPGWNLTQDLEQILAIAEASPLLRGVSFFEFQVRYDKGGPEEDFGMFGLGNYSIADFDYFGDSFGAWCLVPAAAEGDGYLPMPTAVATAYGGQVPNYAGLCLPDPTKVPLSAVGFEQIGAQQSPDRMAAFAARVVEHLGGAVSELEGLHAFAALFAPNAGPPAGGFAEMVDRVSAHPAWASWDARAACVADRLSNAAAVGLAIDWVCSTMPLLDCSIVPEECQGSVWDSADYILGAYYLMQGGGGPLDYCYLGGAAVFAAPATRAAMLGPQSKPQCMPTEPPPTRTTTTSTTSSTRTTPPPFAGNCSFAAAPPNGYFWDEACVAHGGGIGCMADGEHLACRWCGFGPFPACPVAPPVPVSEPAPAPPAAVAPASLATAVPRLAPTPRPALRGAASP